MHTVSNPINKFLTKRYRYTASLRVRVSELVSHELNCIVDIYSWFSIPCIACLTGLWQDAHPAELFELLLGRLVQLQVFESPGNNKLLTG